MDIYAAVDIRGGRCVRLTQGDFGRETVYFEDPVEAARHWLEQNTDWLHVVDLDGSRQGRRVNAEVIRRVIEAAGDTPVQVAGGIRTVETVREVLGDGAARVVLGTAAVRDPKLVVGAAREWPGRVAVAVDARDGEVVIEGWEVGSSRPVEAVADAAAEAGVAALIYTDVAVDGTLEQPDIEGTRALVERVGSQVAVIASGGVASAGDVSRLRAAGAAGVIIGRALYTGDVSLPDALTAARGGQPC